MIVIKIILWILLAVLLIVVLALAIPVRAQFLYNPAEMKLIVKYLFLKFPIDLGSDEEAEKKKNEEEKIKKEEKEKKLKTEKAEKKKSGSETKTKTKSPEEPSKGKSKQTDKKKKPEKKENKVLKWFKTTFKERGLNGLIGVLKEISGLAVTFLKPIFKHLTIKNLDMDIVVAFEDAADTAVKYGYACAGVYPSLAVLLKIMKYKKYRVDIRPDFDKKSTEINVDAEVTLVPWFVIFGAVHALVNFLILRSKGKI